jgi:hypothetical protein
MGLQTIALQPHPQTRIWQFSSGEAATTLTGFEPGFGISLIRAITVQRCSNQPLTALYENRHFALIVQDNAI